MNLFIRARWCFNRWRDDRMLLWVKKNSITGFWVCQISRFWCFALFFFTKTNCESASACKKCHCYVSLGILKWFYRNSVVFLVGIKLYTCVSHTLHHWLKVIASTCSKINLCISHVSVNILCLLWQIYSTAVQHKHCFNVTLSRHCEFIGTFITGNEWKWSR